MFDLRVEKYKKALLIGTGGGNDIVSTLIPAMHLQKKGLKTDIAGVLSPAAIHIFDGKLESVVNEISEKTSRFIPTPTNTHISFVDGYLPNVVNDNGIEINKFYDFSTRFGTTKLIKEVNELIKQNNYDLVIAVDVGGDILARGKKDSKILSPMMDFTTLYLLNNLKVDSYLLEFGLGTDGELRPRGMKEILNELKKDNLLLYESKMLAKDLEIQKFRNVFDEIKKIRAGHTAVMTLQTLDDKLGKDIISKYRFRSQIEKQKWHTPFEVVLPNEYFGKTYLINGSELAKKRTKTIFPYENSLEQYIRLKNISPKWKTEMDLFYLWSENNWSSTKKEGNSLFFLTPSTNIPKNQRNEIIKYGIENVDSNLIMVYNHDKWTFDLHHWDNVDVGQFTLISKYNKHDLLNLAYKMRKYTH